MINYIEALLSPNNLFGRTVAGTDIGVVTPYKAQHMQILYRLEQKFISEGIMVGTAELFQGKERPVMIISTVSVNSLTDFVQEDRVSISLNNF